MYKLVLLFLFILFNSTKVVSQDGGFFRLDSIAPESISLDGAWKIHEGDDSSWASPVYDDSKWDTLSLQEWPSNPKAIHWYRLTLRINDSLTQVPLALLIQQGGASEIYLNGKKLMTYGVVSSDKKTEEGHDPFNTPLIFSFDKSNHQVLAIRYSNHITTRKTRSYGPSVDLAPANDALALTYEANRLFLIFNDLTIGFFTGLTFLHLFLYFFYRADRNNLFYSLFTAFAIILLVGFHIRFYHTNPVLWDYTRNILPLIYPLFFYSLFLLSRNLFDRKTRWFYYLTTGLTAATMLLWVFNSFLYTYFFISLMFNVCFSTVFMIKHAYQAKKEGAVILGTGLLFAVLFLIIILTLAIVNGFKLQRTGVPALVFIFFLMLSVLSIPVSMSVYLARNFAITSRTLADKLREVNRLSEQSLAHAREKEELLAGQNVRLEHMVQERTSEVKDQKNKIEKQKEELENRNREMLASLQYAHFLQQVILPPASFIREKVQDCFILYKPKDIVAGDFYFAEQVGDYFFLAAADCTGHGVPGAMLSVLCSNALNQAVKEFTLFDPGAILDKVNTLVSGTFEKSMQDVHDGMDISLLAVHLKTRAVTWAGANLNLWYSNGSMMEIKGDKQPIGKHIHHHRFTTHTLSGQMFWFYLITDGYADQFGGPDGKKFLRKNLWQLIGTIIEKPASEQKQILEQTFLDWSGRQEQVDDVTIIGVRLA